MAKSAGSLVVIVFALIGIVWFWQDAASFEAFLDEAVTKAADLIMAIVDAISTEIDQRSG